MSWNKMVRSKRTIAAGIVLICAAISPFAYAAGEATLQAVTVQFPVFSAGKQVKLEKDPVVIDGSAYVPLRSLGEALGKQLDWNDWNRTITLQEKPVITNTYELRNPGPIGSGISMGGFSALTRLPGDPDNVFYTMGDRGPNGQIGKDKVRTFPVERFNPAIYKIKVENGAIEIVDTIKLKLPEGKANVVTGDTAVTGLSNLAGPDEIPYDEKGVKVLSYDPDGLDPESIAYNPNDDTFWISEEYRPSLVHVKRDGTVIARYVPQGMKAKLEAAGAQMNLVELLPAIYNNRIANRGFEGVAISPDGKTLYTSIQSPLAVPDKKTGEASRNLRILKVDLETVKVTGEYVYVAENAKDYVKTEQKDEVISDLHALSGSVLLVDERDKLSGADSQIKRVYKSDFSKATNLLGTEWSDKLEGYSVQQLKDLGIVPVTKELAVDLVKLGYQPEKFEGLTVIDKRTIAVVNDNDYQVNYDENANLTFTGVPTQLLTIDVKTDLF
ncbi:esterase-like activity of phytase family protein [Paenibacillus cymbidii]|uniref:esterase-like activity of phytase family protein n=1 Tax=Paenibacillus cymbidii TaxID=1639034 RepID=UPI001F405034|nr:esterase-like activity of phytase family protein [Paenibacillus cymbidii]